MKQNENIEPVTKKLLGIKYGLSANVIGDYLNVQFFEELQKVGYKKEMRILPPIVVRKFVELFGEPLNANDL